MRGLILLFAILLLPFQIHAQSMKVSGVVKDAATGETLPGVTILVKGTNIGLSNDFDGNVSISNLKKGDVLVLFVVQYFFQETLVKGHQAFDPCS